MERTREQNYEALLTNQTPVSIPPQSPASSDSQDGNIQPPLHELLSESSSDPDIDHHQTLALFGLAGPRPRTLRQRAAARNRATRQAERAAAQLEAQNPLRDTSLASPGTSTFFQSDGEDHQRVSHAEFIGHLYQQFMAFLQHLIVAQSQQDLRLGRETALSEAQESYEAHLASRDEVETNFTEEAALLANEDPATSALFSAFIRQLGLVTPAIEIIVGGMRTFRHGRKSLHNAIEANYQWRRTEREHRQVIHDLQLQLGEERPMDVFITYDGEDAEFTEYMDDFDGTMDFTIVPTDFTLNGDNGVFEGLYDVETDIRDIERLDALFEIKKVRIEHAPVAERFTNTSLFGWHGTIDEAMCNFISNALRYLSEIFPLGEEETTEFGQAYEELEVKLVNYATTLHQRKADIDNKSDVVEAKHRTVELLLELLNGVRADSTKNQIAEQLVSAHVEFHEAGASLVQATNSTMAFPPQPSVDAIDAVVAAALEISLDELANLHYAPSPQPNFDHDAEDALRSTQELTLAERESTSRVDGVTESEIDGEVQTDGSAVPSDP